MFNQNLNENILHSAFRAGLCLIFIDEDELIAEHETYLEDGCSYSKTYGDNIEQFYTNLQKDIAWIINRFPKTKYIYKFYAQKPTRPVQGFFRPGNKVQS